MSDVFTKRAVAFNKLNIPQENKLILCLDGGGIRGIMTIQLLKKIEEISKIPCYELFDMVAGTSTGGIIAGLISAKYSAIEIEKLYIKLVKQVFQKRNRISNRYFIPPLFAKLKYRDILKEKISNKTLKEVRKENSIDLLITTKDAVSGEETFFTCFEIEDTFKGTYQNVLLRGIMEATMSAPTYFTPLDRFVDGGTTTYNNPTLPSILEAICYDGKTKYKPDKLTVFSLGTGIEVNINKPEDLLKGTIMNTIFWLKYVMTESGKDACDMQLYLLRSGLLHGIDLRRYQLSLDKDIMNRLPDHSFICPKSKNTTWLKDLTQNELSNVALDDIGKFEMMQAIGEAFVAYICPEHDVASGNWFKEDLINRNNRDLLVTSFGEVDRIKKQMSDPLWLDNCKS